ncbi:hypothetical protein N7475_003549 [Penicillium sp. IBT 31633x]|nr:hypothetical protein N7475_003549 [Penicillium sp. IBT 31633x]
MPLRTRVAANSSFYTISHHLILAGAVDIHGRWRCLLLLIRSRFFRQLVATNADVRWILDNRSYQAPKPYVDENKYHDNPGSPLPNVRLCDALISIILATKAAIVKP